MAAKQLKFKEDARHALEEGVDILANAVRVTLGPRGALCSSGQEVWLPHGH